MNGEVLRGGFPHPRDPIYKWEEGAGPMVVDYQNSTNGKKALLSHGGASLVQRTSGRPHGVRVECEGYRQNVLTQMQHPLPGYSTRGVGVGEERALGGYSH